MYSYGSNDNQSRIWTLQSRTTINYTMVMVYRLVVKLTMASLLLSRTTHEDSIKVTGEVMLPLVLIETLFSTIKHMMNMLE